MAHRARCVKHQLPNYTTEDQAVGEQPKRRSGRKPAMPNGKAKKPHKPRKKKGSPAEAPTMPTVPATAKNGNGQADGGEQYVLPPGRYLSDYKEEKVRYLVADYIAFGVLNLAVGLNDVGKSALLALAISKARFTVLFPSSEEGVGLKLKQRLSYYEVDQSKVYVPEGGDWQLPACKSRLIDMVKHLRADLVAWDNINPHVGNGEHENDSGCVRPALEAAGAIGIATGAALLGNRHPGKGKDNIMRGSGEWLFVPSLIAQLTLQPGSEDEGVIRLHRSRFGTGRQERHYRISREDGAPGIIEIGTKLSADERKILTDEDEALVRQSKRIEARDVIRRTLAKGRETAQYMNTLAKSLEIGQTTWRYAALDLGVKMYQEGFGREERKDWWELP